MAKTIQLYTMCAPKRFQNDLYQLFTKPYTIYLSICTQTADKVLRTLIEAHIVYHIPPVIKFSQMCKTFREPVDTWSI